MANSLNNTVFQQFWARRMQRLNYKVAAYPAIVSVEAQQILKQGDTYHKGSRSLMTTQTYTRGTSVTIQDLTNTDETLVVSTAKVVPFYVDDLDQLQSNYNFTNDYSEDAAVELGNFIDSDILAEYASATSIIDDGALGGVGGNGIQLNTGNVQNVFAAAQARLGRYNVTQNRGGKIGKSGAFAMISPDVQQVLVNYLAGKNSNLGDSTGLNGHIGNYYGFDLYQTNNLTWTETLTMTVQPTNNDTLTLKVVTPDGVSRTITFTFVTTIGTTAGNVLIGAAVDNTRTNLAGLVNTPGTTNATGVALTALNQYAVGRLTATNNTTPGTVTFVGKGNSFYVVSSSFVSASNIWSSPLQVQHCLFGIKGATDMVIQKQPNVEIKEVPDKLGKNILPWTLYGFKTFQTAKPKLIDVPIRTDLYTL